MSKYDVVGGLKRAEEALISLRDAVLNDKLSDEEKLEFFEEFKDGIVDMLSIRADQVKEMMSAWRQWQQ